MAHLVRNLPFLAAAVGLVALSVAGFAMSGGTALGAETDTGVGSVDAGSGPDVSAPLPPAAPVDTNPLNATGADNSGAANANSGNVNNGGVAGTNNSAGVDAAGLPSTGDGGYLDSESGSYSMLYTLIAAVAMTALGGSLVYARARSK